MACLLSLGGGEDILNDHGLFAEFRGEDILNDHGLFAEFRGGEDILNNH